MQIDISGPAGNAFSVMSCVKKAMQNRGYSGATIGMVLTDMSSKDYEHLIKVASKYIDIIGGEE